MFTSFADGALAMEVPHGWDLKWIRGVGWCPSRMHNDMFEKALEWGADMICVIGSDQVHPSGMFDHLLELQKGGHEVISALVPTRESFDGHEAYQRMAWKREGGLPVLIDPDAADVQQINFIGSGVLMFPAELLGKMSKPWLTETITPDNYQREGDCDVRFVWRLQSEAKAKVWVDTTIDVKHSTVVDIDQPFCEKFNAAPSS